MTSEPQVFRSRLNQVLAVALWVVAGAMCLAAALSADPEAWRNLSFAGLLAAIAWAALWAPQVGVDDDGVALRNVTHTAVVPWDAIIEVDTKFALSIRTPRRAYSAWAAPAPGRYSSRVALHTRRRKATPTDGDVLAAEVVGERTSDLPRTDSGNAAILVRSRWQRLLNEDRITIGAAETSPVQIKLHVATLGLLTVLGAASILSAVV